jgi:hypothetical protein
MIAELVAPFRDDDGPVLAVPEFAQLSVVADGRGMITRLLRCEDEQDRPPHADLRCDHGDRGSGAGVAVMMMDHNYNSARFPFLNRIMRRGIENSAEKKLHMLGRAQLWLTDPSSPGGTSYHERRRRPLSSASCTRLACFARSKLGQNLQGNAWHVAIGRQRHDGRPMRCRDASAPRRLPATHRRVRLPERFSDRASATERHDD